MFAFKIYFDVFDEVLQISSWIHSELSQMIKPIDLQTSIRFATILKRLANKCFEVINSNREYYREISKKTVGKLM